MQMIYVHLIFLHVILFNFSRMKYPKIEAEVQFLFYFFGGGGGCKLCVRARVCRIYTHIYTVDGE